jgi:hypothetical protein
MNKAKVFWCGPRFKAPLADVSAVRSIIARVPCSVKELCKGTKLSEKRVNAVLEELQRHRMATEVMPGLWMD